MLPEISEADVRSLTDDSVVFVFTPFCGTCKAGEKMLEVAVQLLQDRAMRTEGRANGSRTPAPVVKLNIHFAPRLVNDWQIASVPCMIKLKSGRFYDKRYRMGNVQELLEWLSGHNE